MTATLLAVAAPPLSPAAAASHLRTPARGGSDAPGAAAPVERVAPGGSSTRPGGTPGALSNVQPWDAVHDLPWVQAFAEYPDRAPAPVLRRRRADWRTLADVVRMTCQRGTE